LLVGGTLALLVAGVAVFRERPPKTDVAARARILSRSPRPTDLNLVVVTLDTTRADHLGCYGAKDAETPAIDALAEDSVVFEHVTAAVPLTLPAHSSIFTGLIPPHHGVRDNGGFFLDEKTPTLAKRLKGVGYATGAFIGAWVLESKWGLAQGFDTYEDKFDLSKFKIVSLGTVQKKGDEVMDGALKWLEGVREQRFFAWVHLYDPHAPYDPPEPYRSRHAGDLYSGEIAYTDHVVGRLLGWLRDRGQLDHTLVVLTADHGESLGEHGEAAHAYFIYDSTTAVPLVIRTPWKDRGRPKTQVASVDILPTILDLLGLPPEPGIDGRSLVRTLFDSGTELGHVAYSETYFPRFHFGWQHLQAMRNGRYHFIEAPTPEFYDLATDPGETQNIYKAYSQRAQELRVLLRKWAGTTSGSVPERQKLDPETLQNLAALGYVGTAGDVDPQAVLPDPKDKIRLFARMGAAKDAAQSDRLEEAVEKMRAVIAEDPKIIDAHLTLGNWLAKTKKSTEAIAEYKEVLTLHPDDETAMSNLAHLYRSLGRSDAAIAGYKAALKLDPKSPQNWYQLATLYLDLGRTDDARETFRQALVFSPNMGSAYNSLGAIAFRTGDLEEAEHLIRKGLLLEPRMPRGHFNLARVLEARGDRKDAEGLYREELEIYADNGKARFNLAQLLREEGDPEGYIRELRNGVQKAPEFGPCYFYLAREELGAGRLQEAQDLARRGLEADPHSEVAALGHYVLADVYSREGAHAKAQQEVAAAHQAEAARRSRGAS
jgi:arylsulfatase A-like enzyme/Flp pilus assembly protein TadD